MDSTRRDGDSRGSRDGGLMTHDELAPAVSAAQIAQAAARFARDGHVRLAPALSEAAAAALHRHLDGELEWWRTVNKGDKVWDLGPQSLAAMADGGDAPLIAAVHAGTRDGFQFLYDSVRVSDDPPARAERDWPVDRLADAFNGADWLDVFRQVTGKAAIVRADGQATRYLPGHFLTGHDDGVEGKHRLVAYVLSLTPRWRIEWGGLLQFHDQDGDVGRALAPRFNAIHLFAVPQVHSVSLVAPFAAAPRYSVTGWLKAA
jgi:SM-20-related protein